MIDYPWWVIRIDESPLSSTCFTVWFVGTILAGLTAMWHLACVKAAGRLVDEAFHARVGLAVIVAVCWWAAPVALPAWVLWRLMLAGARARRR